MLKTRLERLYLERKCSNWEQVANLLGISLSMVMQVKNGRRDFSFKTLKRLEEVERESGIPTPQEVHLSAISQARDIADQTHGDEEIHQKVFDQELNDRLVEITALNELVTKKIAALKTHIGAGLGEKGKSHSQSVGTKSSSGSPSDLEGRLSRADAATKKKG